MEQKRIGKMLKVTAVVVGVILGVFFLLYIPALGHELAYESGYDHIEKLFTPCLVFSWVIALLCFLSLWRFWNVCTEIQNDNSFSMKNASEIQWISRYAIVAGVLFAGLIVAILMSPFATLRWITVLMFCVIISAACATVTYCLSLLIKNAANIKEQNDLTI